MWAEKYRPQNISDLAAQQEVTKVLLGAIKQGQMPHLLFYGPPGTGKTLIAIDFTAPAAAVPNAAFYAKLGVSSAGRKPMSLRRATRFDDGSFERGPAAPPETSKIGHTSVVGFRTGPSSWAPRARTPRR